MKNNLLIHNTKSSIKKVDDAKRKDIKAYRKKKKSVKRINVGYPNGIKLATNSPYQIQTNRARQDFATVVA